LSFEAKLRKALPAFLEFAIGVIHRRRDPLHEALASIAAVLWPWAQKAAKRRLAAYAPEIATSPEVKAFFTVGVLMS